MNYILSTSFGQSMFPTIKHRDRLLIQKSSAIKIKPRDIIVYKNNSYLAMAHRVIKIINTPKGLVFHTRGDFNAGIEMVLQESILGKVVGIYRHNRFRFLSCENSLIYYLFMRALSSFKDALTKIIERIYSFILIRRIIKLFFPLKINCSFREDIKQDDNFKSFYNFFHFSGDRFFPDYGFLARNGNSNVAKLWILNDKRDNYFLYGPYVKLFYRGRGIGSKLVQEALGFLRGKEVKKVYALLLYDKTLMKFFKKLGFSSDSSQLTGFKDVLVLSKQIIMGK